MEYPIHNMEGAAGRIPTIPERDTDVVQETGDETLAAQKKKNRLLIGAGAAVMAAVVAVGGYFALRGGGANASVPGNGGIVNPGPDGGGDINGGAPVTYSPETNTVTVAPTPTEQPTTNPTETPAPVGQNKYSAPTYAELASNPLTESQKAEAIKKLQALFEEWKKTYPNNTYLTDISFFSIGESNPTEYFYWQLGYVETVKDSQGNFITKTTSEISLAELLK